MFLKIRCLSYRNRRIVDGSYERLRFVVSERKRESSPPRPVYSSRGEVGASVSQHHWVAVQHDVRWGACCMRGRPTAPEPCVKLEIHI